MITWDDITLGQFQQIDAVNSRTDISDIDKVLFSTCIIYGMTEHELDQIPKKAIKMAEKVSQVFTKPFNQQPFEKIGKYMMNYDPGTMRFGQYMELSFYVANNYIANAHKVAASMSEGKVKKSWWKKATWENDSAHHADKSEFFLKCPVTRIMGSVGKFMESFIAFNKSYSWLFGLDKETHGNEAQADKFNKTYGWWYSAEAIAAYKRISLDEVYALNIRDAFSSLAYLKAKGKYESEQLKKK